MKHIALALTLCVGAAGGAWAADFTIAKADIRDGQRLSEQQVLKGFGCEGGNISPEVTWTGAPTNTKSFAVTLYDPDAPTGSGWWHWVVFNIPAGVTSLARGAGAGDGGLLPQGALQSRTDFGSAGFGGACPPPGHGPHRYQLTVHALDTDKLDLDANAPAAMVGYFLGQHGLGKASVTGVYAR